MLFASSIQKIAIQDKKRAFSYEELSKHILNLISFLKAKGVKSDSMVAFPAELNPETIALFFAIFYMGAIACPLNHFAKETLLQNWLLKLKEPLFLTQQEIKEGFYYKSSSFIEEKHHLYKPSLLLFTSGSSGSPKIAVLSLNNLILSAKGAATHLGMTEEDAWLLNLPLFHVGGIGVLFRCFLLGGAVALGEENLFNPSVSRLSLVPTQLYRLLQKEEAKEALAKKKSILLGGAFCPPSLFKEAKKEGIPLITSYGMTEMGSVITASTLKDAELSLGKCLPFREYCLKEDKEIAVKGETLFLGYYNRGKIERPLSGDYFLTQDLGSLDEKGNLHILGRKDHMFICGGENIHPEEIERALKEIEGIEEAIVVGVPDSEWGSKPVAFIAKKENFSVDSSLIIHHLKEKLSSIKIPKKYYPLPPYAGIKPSRSFLQKEAEENCKSS